MIDLIDEISQFRILLIFGHQNGQEFIVGTRAVEDRACGLGYSLSMPTAEEDMNVVSGERP